MGDGPGPGLVLGVDGGGTKTHVVVVTTSGEVVGVAHGGCANWEMVGVDAVADELRLAVAAALAAAGAEHGDLVAACCCLAGHDWPSDAAGLRPVLEAAGLPSTSLLTNDSFAVLRAGTPEAMGIASVAGTGGVCAGRNRQGTTARTMAISLGEGSGAGSLVRSALDAAAAAFHRSGPPTALIEALLAATGTADAAAAFEGLSRGTVHLDAGFATSVSATADAGDAVAVAVCADVGAQHGRDVVGLARRLDMVDDTFDVVLAGGVHASGQPDIRRAFTDAVLADVPGARTRLLDCPPVAGAVLLALEAAGVDASSLHPAVTAATARAIATSPGESGSTG